MLLGHLWRQAFWKITLFPNTIFPKIDPLTGFNVLETMLSVTLLLSNNF
jgi:hypothetical protein